MTKENCRSPPRVPCVCICTKRKEDIGSRSGGLQINFVRLGFHLGFSSQHYRATAAGCWESGKCNKCPLPKRARPVNDSAATERKCWQLQHDIRTHVQCISKVMYWHQTKTVHEISRHSLFICCLQGTILENMMWLCKQK